MPHPAHGRGVGVLASGALGMGVTLVTLSVLGLFVARDAALAFVHATWTDMRPLSLRA